MRASDHDGPQIFAVFIWLVGNGFFIRVLVVSRVVALVDGVGFVSWPRCSRMDLRWDFGSAKSPLVPRRGNMTLRCFLLHGCFVAGGI